MSEAMVIVIVSAVINGAVVWGVVRTELKYHRRDIDHAHKRIDAIERRAGRAA